MLTLGTQRTLTNDVLIKGIIDSVVTVNQFYQMLPFKGIQGNALAYNRDSADGEQRLTDVFIAGAHPFNRDKQVFTRHSTDLTTIIGDAQVNGLIQAVGSDFHDATAVQVAAKSKGIGRRYMDLLINGTEKEGFSGLKEMCKINIYKDDRNDPLRYLDKVIDSVTDKDGMVDYIMMNSRGVRKYTAALRKFGLVGYDDVMEIKNSSGGLMKDSIIQRYSNFP